jgi:hypothetical protein
MERTESENGDPIVRAAPPPTLDRALTDLASRWRPTPRGTTLSEKQSLKARVLNGRVILDEPTDLPEGSEVDVVPLVDDFAPTARARLVQAIDDGVEDFERGRHMDRFEFVAQMKAEHEDASR